MIVFMMLYYKSWCWDDDVDVLSLSHSLDFLHSLSFYCIGGVVQVKRKAV